MTVVHASSQVAALKNLGLNIQRAKLKRDDAQGVIKHKFFITDRYTADKVTAQLYPSLCGPCTWLSAATLWHQYAC